ncbi:MAG: hypothetical protein IPK72_02405 [Candidatus Eisenbacteria bacterium]|nr:hypothetical protein [Candidatus Eisenbacteria bacterium]
MTIFTPPVRHPLRASAAVAAGAVVAVAGLLIAPGLGWAEPEPSRGVVSPGALKRVLNEPIPSAMPDGQWEDNEKRSEDAALHEARLPLLGTSDDNDTCHYARGITLVVHVFVNHTGGTWSATEMDDAAAKADAAKMNYTTFAPWAANQSFDPVGGYIFYNATLGYNIADSGMSAAVMEDAVAALGFGDGDGDGSRIDDITHYLQGWGGGWDNVILLFEPDQSGRAWASYGHAKTALYTNSGWWVYAHEWGHLFGACDEYAEGGTCNGGINCGTCQSWYLTETVSNGNCELMACGSTVDCLMKYNTTDALCADTPREWAWVDDNGDGLGNTVRRPTVINGSGQQYANINELFHNGWFVWNNTDQAEVVSQRWSSWSVVGLRSPASADYDLQLFSDNTHNVPLGSSAWGTGNVDFVVGDYNHNNLGNEHIQLSHYSGNFDNYNLTFESGGEVLYPDGLVRGGGWGWYNTAVVYDVPLHAGETLEFYLDAQGGVNLGMALYKSTSSTFFAGRGSSHVAYADAAGVGGDEAFTYTVPQDDVYGLVIWSNNSVDASFAIKIGPDPIAMDEEYVYWGADNPTLWNFTPNASPYWAVIGTRSDTGQDVGMRLFDDPNYQALLDASEQYAAGEPEFVAIDYNHASFGPEYPRVSAPGAPNIYFTQWEQDAEILYGAEYPPYWYPERVVKIWDVWMEAAQFYFFRQFSSGGTLDGGIYLFDSSNADNHKRRSEYANGSDTLPASYGGELFWHVAGASDWYGLVATSHGYTQGSYSMWYGPWLFPTDEVPQTRGEEVVWATGPTEGANWQVAAVRPTAGETSGIWLYEDFAFANSGFRAYDSGSGVRFVVADYNHSGPLAYYTLAQRQSGFGALDLSWEGGTEAIVFAPEGVDAPGLPWEASNVAKVFDLFVDGATPPAGQTVRIQVSDDSGTLNLGVALFASYGGQGYSGSTGALAYADASGIGESETIEFTVTDADWYGLVVFNQEDTEGIYSIIARDPAAAAIEDGAEPVAFGLRLSSANPFARRADLRLSLAESGTVDLAIYDVRGRKVRDLVVGNLPAGAHTIAWDGDDLAGRATAPGVYFARLASGAGERRVKLVKTE